MEQMNDWINKELPQVVDILEQSILAGVRIQEGEGLNITGRNEIAEILDDLLAILFPGAYSKVKVPTSDLNFFIGDMLRHTAFRLRRLLKEIFEFHCLVKKCDSCDCAKHASDACKSLIEALPGIRSMLMTDIQAAFEGDPAAQSPEEIVLSYPCIEAIATYRLAHHLTQLDIPIVPRIMSERAHSKTGIDIHPGAQIAERFFIDHGTGVVIGETVKIGRNVKIYQGVTLGALSPFDKQGVPLAGKKRHPDIEDDVIIYANATILGGKTIVGKGSVIGGNTWITTTIPPGSVVFRGNEQKVLEKTLEYWI